MHWLNYNSIKVSEDEKVACFYFRIIQYVTKCLFHIINYDCMFLIKKGIMDIL